MRLSPGLLQVRRTRAARSPLGAQNKAKQDEPIWQNKAVWQNKADAAK
jgi:hypothetical protein